MMKAYYLLVPLSVVALVGCTINPPPTVAVAPAYVSPPSTVIMGASPATSLDSDGDGFSNAVDRYPFDARYN
jgi:hypothetical protein